MHQLISRLYHISDQSDIHVFEPRTGGHGLKDEPVVWAIDADRLPNYMFPRDCPRVTFFARDDTDPLDTERFFLGTGARRVVAIESGWLQRVREAKLYRYEFDPSGFSSHDETAGYHVSRASVTPVLNVPIDDVLAELLRHDVELRVMASLWKLREAVIGSTLAFSIIRMRNAQPPAEGYGAWHPLSGG